MLPSQNYFHAIEDSLNVFDRKTAAGWVDQLTNALFASADTFNIADGEGIMRKLRDKRMFDAMLKVGDALIQTGRHTYKTRRLYAQALIDKSYMTAAIVFLRELEADTANASGIDEKAKVENTEARGLLGRVYKQLYVNADSPTVNSSVDFLKKAFKYYLDVFISDPQVRTWQGINAVALIKRAEADGIPLAGAPEADSLAGMILKTIREKEKPDAWDFATAAEACVALKEPKEALEWLSGYARMRDCDAFELASTLRQLTEVWRLTMDTDAGRLLLPLLRAELLQKEGGSLVVDAKELIGEREAEAKNSNTYKEMQGSVSPPTEKGPILEKVFGDDSYNTYKWWITGVDRCQAVARIGRDSTKGFGTGFLLDGSALHASLEGEPVLLTNAHVVSDDQAEQRALRSHEAVIIFEALDRDEEFSVGTISWSSPSSELDATVIRFDKADLKRLKQLTKDITLYPLSKVLPVIDAENKQKVYIIGHPAGGTLQVSFQDNLLLDHEDPKIHYRTPTVGGSSGSPVFNQQWQLIGLHHAGGWDMPRLNDKGGTYEANEGIWIGAIKKAIKPK